MQLVPGGHTSPHEPQLLLEVCRFTSQPFAAFPSQSAYPALQLTITQTPPEQPETAFGKAHTLPHAPQFDAEVFVFISQPSIDIPLQFKYPGGQPKLITTKSEDEPQLLLIDHCKV